MRVDSEWIRNLIQTPSAERKLPAGLEIFRGDTRTLDEIETAGGFFPATILAPGEDYLTHAKAQAQAILQTRPNDFINDWKYSMGQTNPLIVGEKGRLAGVCCGFLGGQKSGKEYIIKLPMDLGIVGENRQGIGKIDMYGDAGILGNCTVLAMHMSRAADYEELVFLTPVPFNWIPKEG